MMTSPDSLMARVFKGRYFPHASPLEAKLGERPSYAWRSIHGAQELIKLGARREFGNGHDIDFFIEPWLNEKPPRPPIPRDEIDIEGLPMEFFRDPNSDEWKLSRLNQVFSTEEAKLITRIRPTASPSSQAYSWIYNPNGAYSVKSGYWLWTQSFQKKEDDEISSSYGPSLEPIYQIMWKTDTMPKIQHLLWKCMTNCLYVASNLAKKKLKVSEMCPRCGDKEETINHLLFQCPFTRLVWAISPLACLYFPNSSSSLYQNFASGLLPEAPAKERLGESLELWPWIIWRLWKARNMFCFQAVEYSAQDVLDQVIRDAKEWQAAKEEQPRLVVTPGNTSASLPWNPPPLGVLKCNVDATWKQESDKCGVGWVLRDSEGELRWYGAKCYPALISSVEAEAATLLWAMTCLDNMGKQDVIFEMDCSNLLAALEEPEKWPRLSYFVSEASRQWKSLKPKFSLVKRDRNSVADSIAHFASNFQMYEAVLDCNVPAWLKHLVLKDKSA